MIQQGTIVAIEVETLGSELTGNESIGSTVLNVASTIDFSDLGGNITIGTEVISYSEGAVDDAALTITLDTGLASAYNEGEFVYAGGAEPITRYWAHVLLDGDDDEPVLAEITRPLAVTLESGVRDLDQQETAAVLEERDGTWTVTDVLGVSLGLVGPTIDVPDPDLTGFHVDTDGTMTVGTEKTDPSDPGGYVRIVSTNLWGEIDFGADSAEFDGRILTLATGAGGTRLRQMTIEPPNDDDITSDPTPQVVLEQTVAGGSSITAIPRLIVDRDPFTSGLAPGEVDGVTKFHGARIIKGANQSIASGGGFTLMTGPAADSDTDSFWDNTNDQFVIPSGWPSMWYRLEGQVLWANNTVGVRRVRVFLNNTAISEVIDDAVNSGALDFYIPFNVLLKAAGGALIDIRVFQNSGGNLNVLGDGTLITSTYATLSLVGY